MVASDGALLYSKEVVKGGLEMNDYWLVLFDQQPRRIRVIENLLKNRLSEATIFWAMVYGISDAVASQRHLQRRDFEGWLKHQEQAGLLIKKEGQAYLTPAGLVKKRAYLMNHYRPHFGRWGWQINPERLANRLLLGIQVTSEFAHHNRHYRPLNIGNYEMNAVKQWLIRTGRGVQRTVFEQMNQAFYTLERTDPRLPKALGALLIGYQTNGATLDQLARQLELSQGETAILVRDAWLGMGVLLTETPGPLSTLVAPLISQSPLSASAQQTMADFLRGMSPEQISNRRHRKLSTIRDHLLNAAILTPTVTNFYRLFPAGMLNELGARYQGPVEEWSFLATHPEMDLNQEFFLFRLYQILRCQESD